MTKGIEDHDTNAIFWTSVGITVTGALAWLVIFCIRRELARGRALRQLAPTLGMSMMNEFRLDSSTGLMFTQSGGRAEPPMQESVAGLKTLLFDHAFHEPFLDRTAPARETMTAFTSAQHPFPHLCCTKGTDPGVRGASLNYPTTRSFRTHNHLGKHVAVVSPRIVQMPSQESAQLQHSCKFIEIQDATVNALDPRG